LTHDPQFEKHCSTAFVLQINPKRDVYLYNFDFNVVFDDISNKLNSNLS